MKILINVRPSLVSLDMVRSLLQVLKIDLADERMHVADNLLNPLGERSSADASHLSLTDKIDVSDQLRYFLKERVERILRQIAFRIADRCPNLELAIMSSAKLDEGSTLFIDNLSKALRREVSIRPSEFSREAYTRSVPEAERSLVALAMSKLRLSAEQRDVLMDVARRYIRFGDAWTAERLLERVVADYPDRPQAWSLLGFCANMLGQTIKAERYFELWKRNGTEDDLVRANYVLSMLYLRHHPVFLRDNDRAEDFLDEAYGYLSRRENPDRRTEIQRIFNRNGHALVEFRKGNVDKAIDLLSFGISQLSEDGKDIEKMHKTVLIYNLAQCYRAKGDHSRTVDTYRRVIALDGQYPEYRIELAKILMEKGDVAQASAEVEEARRLDNSILELDNLAVLCATELGERPPEPFEFAYRFAPDNPTFAYNRGLALAEGRRDGEALWAITNANLQQATPNIVVDLASVEAEVWANRGNMAEARQAVTRALDMVGPNEQLQANLSILDNAHLVRPAS